MAAVANDVRSWGQTGHAAKAGGLPLLTQLGHRDIDRGAGWSRCRRDELRATGVPKNPMNELLRPTVSVGRRTDDRETNLSSVIESGMFQIAARNMR
jgi:hypothetical protein